MNIKDLPDDCLLIIFSYFNDLDNLSSFYNVCQRWRDLISMQLVKYEILRGSDDNSLQYYHEADFPMINTSSNSPLERFFPLMPNIKFLAFCFRTSNDCCDYMFSILNNRKSIKGIFDLERSHSLVLSKTVDKLEMLVGTCDLIEKINDNDKLFDLKFNWEQLTSDIAMSQFNKLIKHLPNLQRLNMHGFLDTVESFKGPILFNLKILECCFSYFLYEKMNYGFEFVDFCPSLESVFFSIDEANEIFQTDENLKNIHLRDLVIESPLSTYGYALEWKDLMSLLMKFPNLKHLAIRGSENLRNEDVPKLVKFLPKLVLIDLRGCILIDERAVEYVDKLRRNQPITLIYDKNINDEQINRDWPQLKRSMRKYKSLVCKGFDFMQHCFFRSFRHLPWFMYSQKER